MKTNLFIALITLLLTATAFHVQEDNDKVGDIRYSMLPPTIFETENSGWVLMNGRDVEGSEFYRITGLAKIPDARNQFIRGMGGKFDKADGTDKDGEKRTVGSTQEYSTALPKNKFIYWAAIHKHHYRNKQLCDEGALKSEGDSFQHDGYQAYDTFEGGDPETRPTNITLYTYIKIN